MHRVGYSLLLIMLVSSIGGSVAEAQFRFESEYLLWNRNNDSDATILSGAGGVSADDANFGYASGYRFTLGGSLSFFDVEASFMQVPGWKDSWAGTLVNPLVFDDPTNVNVAPASGLGFVSGLGIAARTPGLEDNEIEFLEAGAQFQSRYNTTFDSFELNFGSNRTVRPVYFALGWRHMELDESAATLLRGTFQAIDSITGDAPGVGGDLPNNGLSHAALAAAGFVVTGGAGDGFLGYDPAAPLTATTLGIAYEGVARNDLDGMQLTLGGNIPLSDIVTLQGGLKGGVYHNRALGIVRESVVGIVNDTSAYSRTFRDRRTSASFAGGAGFDVLVALTDYVNFTLGYDALFITNMAFAGDQSQGIDTDLFGNSRYDLVNNGLFVAHGASVGLQLLW